MAALILYGGLALCVLIGGGLVWKSIGDKAVAANQIKIEKEEAKIQAATETKVALDAQHIRELVDQFDAGLEVGRKNAKRVGARAHADTLANEIFRPENVLPPQSFALYTAALATLRTGEIPDALLVAPIAPAVNQPAAQASPPAPAVPAGATTKPGARPKPKPLP